MEEINIFQPFIDFMVIAGLLLAGMGIVFMILTLWREWSERRHINKSNSYDSKEDITQDRDREYS